MSSVVAKLQEQVDLYRNERDRWLRTSYELEAERDAAIERARKAEREREGLQAKVEGLRECCEHGYELSTHAAAINWQGGRNTDEWLRGLKECIEQVQFTYPGQRRGMRVSDSVLPESAPAERDKG